MMCSFSWFYGSLQVQVQIIQNNYRDRLCHIKVHGQRCFPCQEFKRVAQLSLCQPVLTAEGHGRTLPKAKQPLKGAVPTKSQLCMESRSLRGFCTSHTRQEVDKSPYQTQHRNRLSLSLSLCLTGHSQQLLGVNGKSKSSVEFGMNLNSLKCVVKHTHPK